MNIPVSCGKCRYGKTFDLSIDDLCTHCMVTDSKQDWCDFPSRKDETFRMSGCPLPNLSNKQIEKAERRLKEKTNIDRILYRALNGNTKLIRKRNWSRLRKMAKGSVGKLL